MAIELTARAKALAAQSNLEQQIILDIEGFSDIYGAAPVFEVIKIGSAGLEIGDDWVIGGLIESPSSKDLINVSGTTSTISQQVNIDDGEPNSITRINVNLIDLNGQITEKMSPGGEVDDILATPADVYISFQGGAHPDDSVRVFSGIIDSIQFGAGNVTIGIASPDQYRKQKIFRLYQSTLTSAINNSVTTIPVERTANFIESADCLTSYIKIDDEIMLVNSKTSTSFSVTRAQLGTVAASHDDDAEVESFYRLQENPVELALKLMLSNGGTAFKSDVSASRFIQVSASESVTNAIYFPDFTDIENQLGLTDGDTITITGASESANNVTDRQISGFGRVGSGSYVIVTGAALAIETDSSAVASFKSQYNTLPSDASFGMLPKQVDVAQFQQILSENSSFFVDYDLYVKDTVDGEEFITKNILFPSGLLSTFRKGRSSVVFLAPPLVTKEAPVFDETNIYRPDQIKNDRSISNRFYNAIVYRFNQSAVEDKFLAGEITQSAESTNVIDIGNRDLTIDAPGLRDTTQARQLLRNVSDRFLQRYKFGAERFRLNVAYRDGFNLDLGDCVLLKGRELKLSDTRNRTRDFQARVMEIQDKSINLRTGECSFLLVDTIYKVQARYARVAPASYVDSGATTTKIPLQRSFGTSLLDEENEKWQRLIGEQVLVRSPDFTYAETTTLLGFDSASVNSMTVEALSSAPSSGYIVEPAAYDETNAATNEITKALHCFFNAQIDVASGSSSTQFDVSAGDVGQLSVGMTIRVHSVDYTSDSGDVKITNISGTTITVEDMGFTPTSSDKVDRIGYADGGDPYLYS